MLRRLLAIAAAASLVLCLVVAVIWVRGYVVGEVWHFRPTGRTDTTTAPWGESESWCVQHSIHSGRGRLQFVRSEVQEGKAQAPGRTQAAPDQAVSDLGSGATRSDRWLDALGFGYFKRDKQYFNRPPVRGSYWGFRVLTVPYWFLFGATLALPALWAVRHARRRRQQRRLARQHCPTCGYDLRATPGRCPECGGVT